MISFMLTNIKTKSPKISMYKNNTYIGNSVYSIINSREASINNLFIKEEYRNKYYGSKLLEQTELILKQQHRIQITNLTVHEPELSNLINFFKKNGYIEQLVRRYQYYDDNHYIYTLKPMYKHLIQINQ